MINVTLALYCYSGLQVFLINSFYFSSSGNDNVYFSLIQVLTEHAKNFNIRQRFEQLYSCSSSELIIKENTSEATQIVCYEIEKKRQNKKFKSE